MRRAPVYPPAAGARHTLNARAISRRSVKYSSGPGSMPTPRGSRVPARTEVPSTMVLTRRWSKCGLVKHANDAQFAHFFAELPNALDARLNARR